MSVCSQTNDDPRLYFSKIPQTQTPDPQSHLSQKEIDRIADET